MLVVTAVLSVVLYAIILGFIIFYPLFQEFELAVSIEERAMIASTVLFLHSRLWPAVFLVVALVGVHAIFASHRFFGPIYKFEETIKRFLTGDFSRRIELRRHDSLMEMKDLLNHLAAYLDGVRSGDAEFRAAMGKRLKEVSAAISSGDETKLAEAREILQGLLNDLESSKDAFS